MVEMLTYFIAGSSHRCIKRI